MFPHDPAFSLHPNLAKKPFVADLPLCRLLLEDHAHYPWLFLVPRLPGISRLMDLPPQSQWKLLQELDGIQRILWEEFRPIQLNVAAIGNKTPQLHLHVIARYEEDPAWPHTVWDRPMHPKCDEELKDTRIRQIRRRLGDFPVFANDCPS